MKIVIFCGGFGTRIWPASRRSFPKQFYPLIKGRSFFEITYARFRKKYAPKNIYVSTEEPHVRFVKEQARDLPNENIILEPERRDLLPAVGLVSAVIEKDFPGSVMFFSWSDHLIADEEKFLKAVEAAGKYTQKTGRPVSVNEKPTFASIHNGWLELGKKKGIQDGFDLVQIKRHTEKPSAATAKRYFESNNYLIHTGYGAWRSDLMLLYFKQYANSVYKGLIKIQEARGTDSYASVLKREYSKFEKTSVEYGLYEKLPHDLRLTIAVSTGWEDAGTWQLFYKAVIEKGEENYVGDGVESDFIGSCNNLVMARKGKFVGIIGLNNVVVIDTDDALLVCDMKETEKVKQMFNKLDKTKPRYT